MPKITITGAEGLPPVVTVYGETLESALQKAYDDLVVKTKTSESEGE